MLSRDDSPHDPPRDPGPADDVPPNEADLVDADAAYEDSGPRHGDDVRSAQPAFRIVRARHLREEAPVLPPAEPVDPRRAAERANVTIPMPVVDVDPPRWPGRRTWLAAAAAIVVIVAASFALSTALLTQRSGAPELDIRAAESSRPATIPTQTWSDAPPASPTATPPPSPPPSRTPRPSRSATHQPSAPTQAAAPPPAVPATTAVLVTTPPPTTTPAGPVALPIVPHTGTLKIATSGKCLDDANSSTAETNPMQIYVCSGTAAQTFNFGADGTLGVRGKCVRPASSSPGALLQLRTCDGSNALAWYFRSDKVIVHKESGLCLTNTGALINNVPQSTIATCTAAASQQWTFT